MKRPPVCLELDLLRMNYAQLDGYLLRWYQWLYKGPGRGFTPYWLRALSYSWATRDTQNLRRPRLMTMYVALLERYLNRFEPTS